MKEFFENLKQIRESRGITLEEIAHRSRLPLKYLQDIEAGKLENLPAGYDRIFLKRYLKEIKEDKEEVWRDFNLFFGAGPLHNTVPYSSDIPEKNSKPQIPDETQEEKPEKIKKPNFLQKWLRKRSFNKFYHHVWIFLSITVLGVFVFLAYQQYHFAKSATPEIKEISVVEYINEMQQQEKQLTEEVENNSGAPSADSANFTVELRALKRTWIKEIRDQKDTLEYILNEGIKRKINARESVKFMMGRADGVQIWFNNDSLGIAGNSDEVVLSLVLNQKGIVEKRLKKPQPRKPTPTDSSQITHQLYTPPNRNADQAGNE